MVVLIVMTHYHAINAILIEDFRAENASAGKTKGNPLIVDYVLVGDTIISQTIPIIFRLLNFSMFLMLLKLSGMLRMCIIWYSYS